MQPSHNGSPATPSPALPATAATSISPPARSAPPLPGGCRARPNRAPVTRRASDRVTGLRGSSPDPRRKHARIPPHPPAPNRILHGNRRRHQIPPFISNVAGCRYRVRRKRLLDNIDRRQLRCWPGSVNEGDILRLVAEPVKNIFHKPICHFGWIVVIP